MNITILGTGAFGLALSIALYEGNNHICMWTKFEEEKNVLEKERCYEKVLPGVKIPLGVTFTTDMQKALEKSDLIIFAIPASFMEDVIIEVKKYRKGSEHFLIASKGLDTNTFLFMDAILKKYIHTEKVAVLSGPTFAIDVACKYPVAFSVGTSHEKTAKIISNAFMDSFVKLSFVKDVLSLEICGALKNALAIGSGILCGMGLPISTQCMYLTECLLVLKKCIHIFGGEESAILSYAGVGDLFLTCTSEKSRNFRFGYLIGSGGSFTEIESFQSETTVEGVHALSAFYRFLLKQNIDIPILSLLYKILKDPSQKELFFSYWKENH